MAVIVTALLITGAPRLLVLTLDVPLWTVLVIWGVNGFGSGFLNPVLSVVVLERLPRHVVGRGMSMMGAVTRLGIPLGTPVLGALVGLVGTAPVLVASAAVYLLVASVPVHRRIRAGIRRPSREDGGGSPGEDGDPGNDEGPAGPPRVGRAR